MAREFIQHDHPLLLQLGFIEEADTGSHHA